MARRRLSRNLVLGLAVLAALLGGARFVPPATDIPSGTGYTALELCTKAFVAGEELEHVKATYVVPKVRQLSDLWAIDVVPGKRVEVRTVLPTLAHARAAVYREGLGCTMVTPDTTEQAVLAQALRPIAVAPAGGPDTPWPLGEGAAQGELANDALRTLIERHAAGLLAEARPGNVGTRLNTTSLLVARDGQLLFERYGQGYTRNRLQLGWSMTKTLTALLAGVLAGDGKLAIDAPVGLVRWQGTPKAAITWRQLLNMAPGIEWFEGYGGASDATEMLFSHADQGAWAADRPLTSKPGGVFTYSTGFSNIAMKRMRELLGGSAQAIYEHAQRRLFAPLAMRGALIEPDASGTPVGGARGMLRPVDWLRLGELVLRQGAWNGARIVPEDWMRFMLAPSPADTGYGGSIWRQPTDRVDADLRARLPKDLVFFAGHMGQFLIVVPSAKLLVLRLGASADGGYAAQRRTFELAASILAAGH
jgi:CubicO group peptidase (beta-lactamase class C family)